MGLFCKIQAKPYFRERATDLRVCDGCGDTIYSSVYVLHMKFIYDCKNSVDNETEISFCRSCFEVLNLQV